MVLIFEVSPCVIYWTFEFQFPLGHWVFLQENVLMFLELPFGVLERMKGEYQTS